MFDGYLINKGIACQLETKCLQSEKVTRSTTVKRGVYSNSKRAVSSVASKAYS